ncbi:Sterol regulatory element-binding protein (SREBP), bHLH domain containing transcription factor [Oopsacas minuta]|uniref:Sterol regulatory element-binding protein (SREBP), bHLH domain containing transcription factor n=1 Tax=Oopsacas minuta TaxID=111878 RepID=A0AAV7JWG9_9METZ|nr:Sterol regulatory element-binding protein (SREBP), bHLH domain containing transcription factor [Oopsacas minuta]
MNSSTISFSPDSSGSDTIDWLTNREVLPYPDPDSGVQTDVDYSRSCALDSELLSEFLQPDKQIDNQCAATYQMGSHPSYTHHSPTEYDHMAPYPQNSSTVVPYQFDSEQYRLVHMHREYQKMLLDVEKKIIENKISKIDQANHTDQIITCQDPFSVPISAPSEIVSDKQSQIFPIFGSEVTLPDPRSPLVDFIPKESQVPVTHTRVSKTHKVPIRRNSSSRVQPYTSPTSTAVSSDMREGTGEGVKKRQSHNAIEERYRKRINSKIQELKSIVAPDEPLPKSNILAKALIYIRDLEERNRCLEERVTELNGYGHSSNSSESSPPIMTSSPPALESTVIPNKYFPAHKVPRINNSVKIFCCLFTIVLCLCAPDPVSLWELPSAFASRDQFGGLGSAVFRSRTLLYLSESSVGTSLRQSSSLIHPFSLLSWSVRFSLISLSLIVLVYSAKLLFPRSLSADHSQFIKLTGQAGVEFREKRFDHSLYLLRIAFEELGFYLELSMPRLVLSLLLEAGYLCALRFIRYTYLRFFTPCQRETELNLTLLREIILSLHLSQRVQTAKRCSLSCIYSSLTAHTLAQCYISTLPLYLVQYSQQSLLQLLDKKSEYLTERVIIAVLKLSVGSTDTVTSDTCSRHELSLWRNNPQTEEWDIDREIQTQVFCFELSVLLQSTISLQHTQKQDSIHAQRFSSHIQSLPPSTGELTHWWATVGVMASEWKRGIASDQQTYSNFFKNVPSSLINSSLVLPKALLLTSRFRISVHSSPLHRPALLVRVSQEATELIWSSYQHDDVKTDSKDLFLLLQALCCKWVLDGLIQLWKKSGNTHYDIFQSYLSGIFLLEKLADSHPFLTELLSYQTSLSFSLSNSNPCQSDRQLDTIRQNSILSY